MYENLLQVYFVGLMSSY